MSLFYRFRVGVDLLFYPNKFSVLCMGISSANIQMINDFPAIFVRSSNFISAALIFFFLLGWEILSKEVGSEAEMSVERDIIVF